MKDRYRRTKYWCRCDRAMAIPGKKCPVCNHLEDGPIPRIENKLKLKQYFGYGHGLPDEISPFDLLNADNSRFDNIENKNVKIVNIPKIKK